MDGRYIKHMAFAVKDAKAALKTYQDLLSVGLEAKIEDYPKSRNRVALFWVGDVEYQLCQSLDEGGRFDKWIKERGYELRHVSRVESGSPATGTKAIHDQELADLMDETFQDL